MHPLQDNEVVHFYLTKEYSLTSEQAKKLNRKENFIFFLSKLLGKIPWSEDFIFYRVGSFKRSIIVTKDQGIIVTDKDMTDLGTGIAVGTFYSTMPTDKWLSTGYYTSVVNSLDRFDEI